MTRLRFLTAGESHGKGLTVILEGVPAGLPVDEDYLAVDLRRRQRGYGRSKRQRLESDRAEVLSGVRHGVTLGSPIALFIANRVWDDWKEVMSVDSIGSDPKRVTRLRPGHADLVGAMKYGFDDIRNVLERASARETAARVAAGAVCRRMLEEFSISVGSHTVSIGGITVPAMGELDWKAIEKSPVRCVDPETSQKMVNAIDSAREAGDTLGGLFEVRADGLPIGIGSHVHWDRKLDGRLAQAVMSIHAVKGVEIGSGFSLASRSGVRSHDVMVPIDRWDGRPFRRASNRAGGLEGGVTNGEPIIVRAVLKPIATLSKPLPSVDLDSGEEVQAHYERSDVCVVPAAGVVGEAMVALVLAEAMLEKFGGDCLHEVKRNWKNYLKTVGRRAELR